MGLGQPRRATRPWSLFHEHPIRSPSERLPDRQRHPGSSAEPWRYGEHRSHLTSEGIPRRGPWSSFEAAEYATLKGVNWSNNRRLPEPIGNIPPADAEADFCAAPEQSTWPRSYEEPASGKPGAVHPDSLILSSAVSRKLRMMGMLLIGPGSASSYNGGVEVAKISDPSRPLHRVCG